MRSWRAFLESVHVVSLSLWLGALAMSGVVAARVFTIMRGLDPRLESFNAYTGEHWRLAGGKIANEVFFITDIVQFSCAFLAALSFAGLVITRSLSPRQPSTWIRGLGLSISMASLMGLLLIVTPQLNTALKTYWSAAHAGRNDEALRFQAIAGEIHPTASTLMSVTAVAVLMTLVAAAWSLGKGSGISSSSLAGGPASDKAIGATPYPEPELLRRKGRV